MTEPTQPGSTGEAFPRFSWWRVLVGAALPLILMAAYFQLISLVLHPELPFSLEAFFFYVRLLPLLLGLPLLLLGILAESIQPGLSDRAFWLTGACTGAAAAPWSPRWSSPTPTWTSPSGGVGVGPTIPWPTARRPSSGPTHASAPR